MSILQVLFSGKSTAITSATVRDEVARAEAEISIHRTNLDSAMSSIATMSDAEHLKAEADIGVMNRAIARLGARVSHLAAELPNLLAAEEAAAKIAADEALRRRAASARKANSKEAAALLQQYAKLAEQVADIFARLDDISAETAAVNNELRLNPVAERVLGYNNIHRKHLDREASERRELRLGWVDGDGSFNEATLDKAETPARRLQR